MTEQILAVQRMQDYIEANLKEKITLAELSRAALFSPWYSYRLFQSYTGLTPPCYIRRLRLARAAMKLKNENRRIIDTAYELGFENADGFTVNSECVRATMPEILSRSLFSCLTA